MKIIKATLLFLLVAGPAFATKTTYITTDRKFNFVKRVELKEKELKKRGTADQPHTFVPMELKNMLSGVAVSHQLVLSKEADSEEVFDSVGLDFLVPNLVEAFKQAGPNEEIIFSFIARKSKTLFQDNRLTLASTWVKDGFLHLAFRKLLAKIDTTNYDKLGDVSTAMNRAKGIRIALELKPGQEFGKSTDELMVKIGGTALMMKKEETTKKEAKPVPVLVNSDVEARLKKLQELKDQNLISKKEFEGKKKEILKDL